LGHCRYLEQGGEIDKLIVPPHLLPCPEARDAPGAIVGAADVEVWASPRHGLPGRIVDVSIYLDRTRLRLKSKTVVRRIFVQYY